MPNFIKKLASEMDQDSGFRSRHRAADLAQCASSIITVVIEEIEASERDRTSDLLITNQSLYRLSYAGAARKEG